MIDFGDDRLTAGRPHPMIDGSMRGRAGARARSPTRRRGVLLLDVVLGLGRRRRPGRASCADAVRAATTAGVPVVVVGGRHPRRPAGPARPRSRRSHDAGAWVFLSNAAAARCAARPARSGGTA